MKISYKALIVGTILFLTLGFIVLGAVTILPAKGNDIPRVTLVQTKDSHGFNVDCFITESVNGAGVAMECFDPR